VFNAHPAAAKCAAMATRAFNQAIHRETGIENIACIIEEPTLESFEAICRHELVKLLLVTGGPGVVKAAMQMGKRAICAGPGNPPVFVDSTACMKKTATKVIQGAAYDNNLLCIGEKQLFALDKIADSLMAELGQRGAFKLNPSQLDALTKAAFTLTPGTGGARVGQERLDWSRCAGAREGRRRQRPGRHAAAVCRDRCRASVRHGGADDALPADRAGGQRGRGHPARL
jgi:aldehyde dehydrogenase